MLVILALLVAQHDIVNFAIDSYWMIRAVQFCYCFVQRYLIHIVLIMQSHS